jgi:transposase
VHVVAAQFEFLLAQKDAEITRLHEELARLHEELARLHEELGGLREELARVLAELGHATANTRELTVRIEKLTDAIARSNERISELLAMVGRKKKAPAEPKARPEPEAPLADAAAREAFDNRPQPPVEQLLCDRPRPKQVPTGRKPIPGHVEREESTIYPDRCSCGCTRFDWIEEVVEEKLHVQAHQRVRRTVRKTGRCQDCGERSTAEAPPSPFERSKVTPEWLAWLVVNKFEWHVTLERVRRSLSFQGLPLAISFFVTQIEAAADILAPIDGVHWRRLLSADAMGSDGTGLKVQIPGAGLHHGFIEVYHNADQVVFQYEAEKGGETQASKLAKFEGALLVDAESRYNETFRLHPNIIEYNCNAHPRRKLRDAESVQPVLAAEAGRFVRAMFDEEADAKTQGLTGEALCAWRQSRIRPLYEQFRVWIDAVKPTLLPSDALAKVLQYYINHWKPLTAFLDNADVPIDNSGSERHFQAVAKLRLNSMFAGGTEGAHRATVLLGIAATCRLVGVDLHAYLTWVFIRAGTHRARYNLAPAELTPDAYKRTLAATAAK